MKLPSPAELFGRYRLLVALLVMGMTALAAWGMTRLKFDDVPRNVFRSGSDDYRELQRFFADFESDDTDCLVVVKAPPTCLPRKRLTFCGS